MQSNIATEMQPISPEVVLTQIAFGAMMTQALYVAAKLGIADLLKNAPEPVRLLFPVRQNRTRRAHDETAHI